MRQALPKCRQRRYDGQLRWIRRVDPPPAAGYGQPEGTAGGWGLPVPFLSPCSSAGKASTCRRRNEHGLGSSTSSTAGPLKLERPLALDPSVSNPGPRIGSSGIGCARRRRSIDARMASCSRGPAGERAFRVGGAARKAGQGEWLKRLRLALFGVQPPTARVVGKGAGAARKPRGLQGGRGQPSAEAA